MEKFLKIIVLFYILLVYETLISIIISLFYENFDKSNASDDIIMSTQLLIILLAIQRSIYYLGIFTVLFYPLNLLLNLKNKVIKLILLNTGLFILISLLYSHIFKMHVVLDYLDSEVCIILISTVISPIALNYTPYFKRFLYIS